MSVREKSMFLGKIRLRLWLWEDTKINKDRKGEFGRLKDWKLKLKSLLWYFIFEEKGVGDRNLLVSKMGLIKILLLN